jgi:hypothetical protein
VRQALAGELLSLANLLGRPVVDPAGARVGRVSDIVVRWDTGTAHPPVAAVVAGIGRGLARVSAGQVDLAQSMVRLRGPRVVAAVSEYHDDEVALVRDVLDRQLIDVTGVEVVRASDVYLVKRASEWDLAGIDVGTRALLRRLLPKRRTSPPPDRVLDWADLQAFAPRFPDETTPESAGPAAAAGISGSSMQTASPAAALRRLRAKDVAHLLAGLDRGSQAQLTALADTSTVAEALSALEPDKLDALLAELDSVDRAKLEGLLPGSGTR